MKFWLMMMVLGLRLRWLAWRNPDFRKQLENRDVVMQWLKSANLAQIAERVQATDIRWVSNGESCQISLAMRSCALRMEVIRMMNIATGSQRIVGPPRQGS